METKWLARVIGIVILLGASTAAVVLWLIIALQQPFDSSLPVEEDFAGFTFTVARVRPPDWALWASISIAVLAVALVAAVERFTTKRTVTKLDPLKAPLAPRLIMEQTRGHFDGPVTVTVLIPAYNEEDALRITLPSLLHQTRPPERIIVVADNCTDGTRAVAEEFGVEAFETVANTLKKAGALNQVLEVVLPGQGNNDLVMVMDADTALDAGFIEAAVERFVGDRALMAVGGLFSGEEGHGMLGQFQRNEYTRYSRVIRRRKGRVFVLTGTSSMFRPTALRAVAASRGVTIPGVPGDVYDTIALTEDNELTIALKSLGAVMVSPSKCTVTTELMPTWRYLWRQRMRWQRGAVENIGAYGLTPATFRYWGQQMGIGYGVLAYYSFLLLMLVTVLAVNEWWWFPFWLGIGLLFIVEQVVTVWRGGWRARLLAALLFPELGYAMFIQAVYVVGIVDITLKRRARWGGVNRTTAKVGA